MSGRKPLPKLIKIAEGTYRDDRANNEPVPEKLDRRDPPSWIRDRLSRKMWRKFYDQLYPIGLLTKIDIVALELLVTTYVKWREASDKAKVGIYKTQTGYVACNPLINVENRYAKDLRALLTEFGMTPSSRSRINLQLGGEDEDEDLD